MSCGRKSDRCRLRVDHILTMQQSLNFFEVTLSHNHPVYVALVRLTYLAARIGNDKALARLYIIVLTFLAITIVTGSICSTVGQSEADDFSMQACSA